MVKKILIGLGAIAILIGAFYALNYYIYSEKQGPNGFQPGYKDIAYVLEGKPVALKDGVAVSIDAGPGFISTTTTRYFGNEAEGDLNGDGVSDIAFILTQNGGGSGTFVYAVAALKTDTGYIGTNGVLLGDRIAPQSTEIRDGVLIVNYADRKANEPMITPPSVGVSLYLKIKDNRLVPETGDYGYRCGDGTEFTMTPSSDMGSITLIPASSIERIPRLVLHSVPRSPSRFEGEGYAFEGKGETVTLTGGGFSVTCRPMQDPEEAPFNFGD